jgi:hypothetical protein
VRAQRGVDGHRVAARGRTQHRVRPGARRVGTKRGEVQGPVRGPACGMAGRR